MATLQFAQRYMCCLQAPFIVGNYRKASCEAKHKAGFLQKGFLYISVGLEGTTVWRQSTFIQLNPEVTFNHLANAGPNRGTEHWLVLVPRCILLESQLAAVAQTACQSSSADDRPGALCPCSQNESCNLLEVSACLQQVVSLLTLLGFFSLLPSACKLCLYMFASILSYFQKVWFE